MALDDIIHNKEFQEVLCEDIANMGRSCFFTGLPNIYSIRCAALAKVSEINDGDKDLPVDEVKKLLPYLAVVEKCCNIIDKATVERIREDGG